MSAYLFIIVITLCLITLGSSFILSQSKSLLSSTSSVSSSVSAAAKNVKTNHIHTNLKMIAVGDTPPDFSLLNAEGKSITLSQYKNKKSVVIFFYPADNSPGKCSYYTDTFPYLTI